MKRITNLNRRRIESTDLMLLMILILSNILGTAVSAQSYINGKIFDSKSKLAIPYANVVLFQDSDSMLVKGTISDTAGQFTIKPVLEGNYRLLIAELGYQKISTALKVLSGQNYDLGNVYLQENVFELGEAVVTGERLKAKTEQDKTTFFISKKMVDASNTGADILKLIPGVQIDLMNNILLEGSKNIMILVDGRERDKNFVSQIDPRQIDKIEILNTPPSKYDAGVTGVMNIVLKKNRDSGINGQIYAEIPTTSSVIYLQPMYSFNYGFKKLNFFTSYNGELSYFDIHINSFRKFTDSSGVHEISSTQSVRQKNWSHRFHFGFDYFLNAKNQVNFYGYFNPYSWEHDGLVEQQTNGFKTSRWKAGKNDSDINHSTFYSLYLKHNFNEKGNEIAFDISNYNLKAENSTTYIPDEWQNDADTIVNKANPQQNDLSVKVDYNKAISTYLNFALGFKAKLQSMYDSNSNRFNYSENVFAAYGTAGYKKGKFDFSLGLRLEKSISDLENEFRNTSLSLLPHAIFNFKFTSSQNIQISLNRTVNRPKIYQLNPTVSTDDPFSVKEGNSTLKPEFHNNFFIENSIRFNNNFISTRLFYNNTTDAINNLTFINDTSIVETGIYNAGTFHQYGFQFTGALLLGKIFSFNPYMRIYGLNTKVNGFAQQFALTNRQQIGIESSFSALLSFKNDFNLSLIFQYASAKNNIQDNWFCDALYFVSFEKTFKKNYKVRNFIRPSPKQKIHLSGK